MMDEIGEQFAAIGRVDDFGVEHQAVALGRLVGGDGVGCALRAGDDLKPRGQRFDPVAVAHPHLALVADRPQAVEQGPRARQCR